MAQKIKTKTALRNYQKVIKSSFNAATNHFGFIEHDSSTSISISRMQSLAVKNIFIPQKKSGCGCILPYDIMRL